MNLKLKKNLLVLVSFHPFLSQATCCLFQLAMYQRPSYFHILCQLAQREHRFILTQGNRGQGVIGIALHERQLAAETFHDC